MGNSSSSATSNQKSNTKVVNQSDLNLLNSTLNNTIVNTVVQTVQSCSQQMISSQNLVVANVHTTGSININTTQEQQTYLNFSCAQNSTTLSAVNAALTSQIMAAIQNNFSNNVLSQFNTLAAANAQNQFGSAGSSNSSTSTNQSNKSTVKTTTNQNLQNLVTNNVTSNFTDQTFNSCLAQVISTQTTVLTNLSGSSFNFTSNQDQAIQVYTNCVQSSGVANQITSSLANTLGLQVNNNVATTATTELKAESVSESTAGGIFQGLGDLIAAPINALLAPLNNLLSDLGLSSLSGALSGIIGLSSSSCLCICIIIIIFVLFHFVF